MTLQKQMKEKLAQVGLPYKEINCYGNQIVIICVGYETGKKWVSILSKFTTKQNMVKTILYNKENKGTCLLPSTHDAYLIGATI